MIDKMNRKQFLLLLLMAVHTSGAIRPMTTQDSQQRCGSVLCKIITDIFAQNGLKIGTYNIIATLPMGAMNFSAKPLALSDNLLALRTLDGTFIINGQNQESRSGLYEYNGDTFDYNVDISLLTAKGPLKQAVDLLLMVRGANPGIIYEYIIPIPSEAVSEEDELQAQWNEVGQSLDETEENSSKEGNIRAKERHRRKFNWKLLGFGPCSRTCGPGVQHPIFRCIRDAPTRFYTPKRCAHIEKPLFSIDIYQCSRGLCPAFWRVYDVEKHCKCENAAIFEGIRQRKVECVQERITGQLQTLNETHCDSKEQPLTTEKCKCSSYKTATSVYATLTRENTTKKMSFISNSTSPLRRHLRNGRIEKTGVWIKSAWSEQCASTQTCDLIGFEHRSIYCDRTLPYTDLCDSRFTPQQKRACMQSKECVHGNWLISEWSNCTGDCFQLQRKRLVICLQQGKLVDEAVCEKHEKKPNTSKNCTQNETDYCIPQWHYSEWSECSSTCGEGQQRRYAKCLEYDWKQNILVESGKCVFKEREPVFGTCNLQNCEVHNYISENVDRSTTMAPCTDDFNNCKRIKRQHLCKLPYYKLYCCQTCQNYL